MTSTRSEPHAERASWSGLVLVCLAGVVWGTIGPAVALLHQRSGLSPFTMGAYRSALALAVLLAVAAAGGQLRSSVAVLRLRWRRVGLVGALTAAFQLLFFLAVLGAGVSSATVVALGVAPVLLAVVDGVRRPGRPWAPRALPVAAALVGLVLVGASGSGGGAAPHPVLGLAAAVGSGVAYALSADLGAPLSRELDVLSLTLGTVAVVALVLAPGGLVVAALRGERLSTDDGASWLLLGHLGVVTMALAYALLFAGLRSTPSGTAVVATLLEPVTAVLIAVAVLGEHLGADGLAGSLLVVGAISTLGRRGGVSAPADLRRSPRAPWPGRRPGSSPSPERDR